MSDITDNFFEGKRPWSIIKDQVLEGYMSPYIAKVVKSSKIKNQSVFLYLDPFGPTGCDFTLLEPFLNRNPSFSTEIMLTMHMPSMHRFASRHAVEEGRQNDPFIQDFHQKLSKILGGDYWRDILLKKGISREEREIQLIEAYKAKLTQYLPFTRSCPVRERTDSHIKYFIVFASHHKDALVLLNDIMVRAYFARMHQGDLGGGLWEDTDWREMRSIGGLDNIVVDIVAKHPGKTRKSIWSHVVEDHFMRYLESEYTHQVQSLVDNGQLISPTLRKTKRLNEDCILFPGNKAT